MASQYEIADDLGIVQPTARQLIKRADIPDYQDLTVEQVRHRLVRYWMNKTANRGGDDGYDLQTERAKTERVTRELRELQVAEKRGALVNIAQLEPALQQAFSAFRAELLSRDDKLAEALHAKYQIKVDLDLLNEFTFRALEQLSRYQPRSGLFAAEADIESEASGEDIYDGVGEAA